MTKIEQAVKNKHTISITMINPGNLHMKATNNFQGYQTGMEIITFIM